MGEFGTSFMMPRKFTAKWVFLFLNSAEWFPGEAESFDLEKIFRIISNLTFLVYCEYVWYVLISGIAYWAQPSQLVNKVGRVMRLLRMMHKNDFIEFEMFVQ